MHKRNSKPVPDRKQYGRKIAAEVEAMEKESPLEQLDNAMWDIRYTLAPAPTPKAFDLCLDVPWLGRRLPVLGEVK